MAPAAARTAWDAEPNSPVHLGRRKRYIGVMHNLFFFLILAAMVATVVALVRGIIAFLKTTEEDLKGGGLNQSALKQNKMMRMRIAFQAIAIILVILMLMMSRG